MSKIAVVYHSGYGHTQRMAQAVAEGAGAELIAIDAEGNLAEAAWEQLAQADVIIMGSPTYMGTVSWQFKKFADASSKAWYSQAWKDKLFAGFTNSAAINGDKGSTLTYLFTLAMQHGGALRGSERDGAGSEQCTQHQAHSAGLCRRQLHSRQRQHPCPILKLPGWEGHCEFAHDGKCHSGPDSCFGYFLFICPPEPVKQRYRVLAFRAYCRVQLLFYWAVLVGAAHAHHTHYRRKIVRSSQGTG
jgi:multimeric flavodoxin WrbA